MEAKLPQFPKHVTSFDVGVGDSWNMCQNDMLKFFVYFLDEHIELNKSKTWDTMQLEALKINFKYRFMNEAK